MLSPIYRLKKGWGSDLVDPEELQFSAAKRPPPK